MVDSTSAPGRTHVRLPLNLTCITAGQLRRLGLALDITISGSINDQRLVVEGTLSDEGHDPCNIQVVFAEYSSEATFVLCDEEGEFLTVPVAASTTEVTPEVVVHESEHSSEESGDEIETLRQTVEDITTERDALQAQLQEVIQALEQKKSRIKELWKISCGQVEEFDAMVVAKNKQIAVLKAQLAAQKQQRTPNSSDDDSVSSVTVSVLEKQRHKDSRRGHAPPIDLFNGEDPSV